MSLVPSLLQAIVRVDGDALVMHAGDKPYVVSPTGQVDLASRGLTLEAVNGIVAQLLPIELQNALDEFGAVQHELAPMAEFPGEHFTIVAARGGDDVWAEIRRRRIPEDDRVPEEFFAPPPQASFAARDTLAASSRPAAAAAPPRVHSQNHDDRPAVAAPAPPAPVPAAARAAAPAELHDEAAEPDADLFPPDEEHLWPGRGAPEPPATQAAAAQDETVHVDADAGGDLHDEEMELEPPIEMPADATHGVESTGTREEEAPPIAANVDTPGKAPATAAWVETPKPVPLPPISVLIAPAYPDAPSSPPVLPAPPQAVVLNMSRSPIRSDAPPPAVEDPTLSGLERLLRVASARGASALYLSAGSRPSVRVDGELQTLDGEPVHVARDVESLVLTLMPGRNHEALRTGAATEWILDLEGVGRIRCMSFRDQRGPGGVFRLMPTRSVSADQLGLSTQVQALAIEPEGLVLVAGARSSGKRTTMSAFVDLMNRTRRDHIITIEREINIQHERGNSFISQREVRGGDEEVLAAARAAIREDPDVLVIEELRTGALVNVALEAAAAGRLVIGGFTAHTATGAVDRVIDLYAPEYHRQVQMALAGSLRGVIVQVLLRKVGGGRLPAREVLLNTPAVSGAIAEGKTSQLPMAIEGGRRHGMMPLNDALVGLVQTGVVEAKEAYRRSADRAGFLAALHRQGIDTSFVERLANG
jgi:twitching motility protein PilT